MRRTFNVDREICQPTGVQTDRAFLIQAALFVSRWSIVLPRL